MRSGELFAGVGGLEMAINAVFDADTAFMAEFDEAPSKVLEARYPGVPNLGDVTTVDWEKLDVEVLGGGFPCTDVSQAGRMAGLRDGTRSGLWSEYRLAIATLRPDWVVIENVRGLLTSFGEAPHPAYVEAAADVDRWDRVLLLIDHKTTKWSTNREYVKTKRQERVRAARHRKRAVDRREREGRLVRRAIDTVLRDLALIGFDAEWTGLRAADIGAPHGRFRVFILAWPRERTPADAGGGRNGGGPSRHSEGTRADAPIDGSDPRDDRRPSADPDRDGFQFKRGGGGPMNVTLTDAVVRTELGTIPNPRHFSPPPPLPTRTTGKTPPHGSPDANA